MPWVKGQSGNPGGRPKRKLVTDELRRLLEETATKRGDKITARAIAERLIRIILRGKNKDAIEATKLLLAYVEGMPTQAVQVELRETAQRIAERTGADPDWLIRRAEEIAKQAASEATA